MLVADRASTLRCSRRPSRSAPIPSAAANWITQDLAGLANKHGAEAAARVSAAAPGGPARDARRRRDQRRRREAGTRGSGRDRRRHRRRSSSARGFARSPTRGELGAIVDEVLAENADAAQKFRDGNEGVIGFLVGTGHEGLGRLGEPEARAGVAARAPAGLRSRGGRVSGGPCSRGTPKRIPLWQLALYGMSSLAAGRGAPVRAHVALERPDRQLRAEPLHERRGRRDAGDRAGRLGLLLVAGRRGEAARGRLPRPDDGAAGLGRAAARAPARPGGTSPADGVRLGGGTGPRSPIYAAPRFDTLVLFPAALALLVLSKVHGITKNGLTIAYAGPG